jgi:hypothetical protein
MTSIAQSSHFQSTASGRFAADTLSGDLSELGQHLGTCQNTHRHLLTLRCTALSARGFIATRLVTTAMVGVAFLGLFAWLG